MPEYGKFLLNKQTGLPRKSCLWNPDTWALESRMQLMESGIKNPSSTDKNWNPYLESGTHRVKSRWDTLQGAIGRHRMTSLRL